MLSPSRNETRAQAPKAPVLSAGMRKARVEWESYRAARELVESRSVLRGLISLALLALLVSLVCAGAERAFYTGWWRQW